MRKASEYLSKPVIGISDGRALGIVKNISFDKRVSAAEWLVLYDENDADCEEKVVSFTDIAAVGADAVMIASAQSAVCIASAPVEGNNPINSRVYTAAGSLLGVVTDVAFSSEYAVLEFVCDTDKHLPLSGVHAAGNGIIVAKEGLTGGVLEIPVKKVPAPRKSDIKRKVKALAGVSKPPRRPAAAQDGPPVFMSEADYSKTETDDKAEDKGEVEAENEKDILGIPVPLEKIAPAEKKKANAVEIASAPVSETPVSNTEPETTKTVQPPDGSAHIPERIITEYDFLLGRIVGENVYSGGEVLISEDTVVCTDIVETARKYGRLVDLTKVLNK